MQVVAARRFDAANRAEIFVRAGDGGGRHRAVRHQTALAIEVAQNHFQQLRALLDTGGELLPVGLVDDQRQMTQRPQPVGGLAGRTIGDAGFAQMPVGGSKSPLDIGRRQPCEGIEEPGPGRTRGAVLADIFIGNSGQPRIVARPLRHPALARTGLVFLTIALSRHSNSREQN